MPFTVTYNANGATDGDPPVDPHTYNPGDQVTVLPPGGLAKTGSPFARWNTAADGSGTAYGWPTDSTFAMGTSNVTLYAQWYTVDGLIDNGVTRYYTFMYESSLKNRGLEPARTNELLAQISPLSARTYVVDDDFDTMSAWFGHIPVNSVITMPITVYVANLGGGANGTDVVTLKPGNGDATLLRYLIVSEVVEFFMNAQNKGWFSTDGSGNEQSCGEALSRYLAQQFLEIKDVGIVSEPGFGVSSLWLNSALPTSNPSSTRLGDWTALTDDVNATQTTIKVATASRRPFSDPYVIQIDSEQMQVTSVDTAAKTFTVRRGFNGSTAAAHAAKTAGKATKVQQDYGSRADYVNVTLEWDNRQDAATGCALLFLYYLHYQLGYETPLIISNAPGIGADNNTIGGSCLRGVFRGLTGDQADPFPAFKVLLDSAFAADAPATIAGANPDNPFPIVPAGGGGGGGGGLGGCPGIRARYHSHLRLLEQYQRQLQQATTQEMKDYLQAKIEVENQIISGLEDDWTQECHGPLS
jgi:hypothetical protein